MYMYNIMYMDLRTRKMYGPEAVRLKLVLKKKPTIICDKNI